VVKDWGHVIGRSVKAGCKRRHQLIEAVYRPLCATMAKRSGMYPEKDIPEFYALVRSLFTLEEAAVSNAVPRGFHPVATIADALAMPAASVALLMEQMANKGLCISGKKGWPAYMALRRLFRAYLNISSCGAHIRHGIKKLARLIRDDTTAIDKDRKRRYHAFPAMRVITVERTTKVGSEIHTDDQVRSYIEVNTPLAVSSCYCSPQARLFDVACHWGNPDEVCLQFGRCDRP
jgi:hypothetical protein